MYSMHGDMICWDLRWMVIDIIRNMYVIPYQWMAANATQVSYRNHIVLLEHWLPPL